MKLKKPLSFMG